SDQPVNVQMSTGTLRGNSMVLLQRSREVTFSDGVTATLRGQPKAVRSPPEPASALRRMTAGDGPVDVTSPHLKIDDPKKTALFPGGVRAVQSDTVLTAHELEVAYEGAATPGAAAQGSALPGADAGGRVKRLYARDNLVLTRGNDRVTSD